MPSADAIVKSVWNVRRASAPESAAQVAPLPPSFEATKKRPAARRLRWPVFLCGFLAGISGGIALMKSPVGKTPRVQHVVAASKQRVASAFLALHVTESRVAQR
jgi:hypothetical protein